MKVKDAQRMFMSAPDHDVKRFTDADAMDERIKDWLETPEGTVAHNPSWGHNLERFKFDPLSKDLDVLIEMAIVQKLPLDVDDIVLKGVNVEVMEIDFCRIDILHQFGVSVNEVNLGG